MNSHMWSAVQISGGNMTSNADVMVLEFVLALDDLHNDPANSRKLMDCVRSHYVNNLSATDFCSALERRLSDQDPVHQLPVNDPSIIYNFYGELSCVYTDHSKMEKMLKSMDKSYDKKLRLIGFFRKSCSVFFTIAAMICAAATAIVAANAIHNRSWERAGVAVPAAAVAILFTALGKWLQSVLKKDEAALRKHKQITEHIIFGAERGVEYTKSIHDMARKLDFASKYLSGMAYDRKKVVEVENSLIRLRRKDEEYSDEMRLVKQLVIKRIIKTFD